MIVQIHQFYKSLPATQFDKVCRHCNVKNRILVETDLLLQWRSGTYIQDVFPHLDDDQRELMISGTHPECFQEMFG